MTAVDDPVVEDAAWWRTAKRWGRTLAGREALLLLGAAAVVQLVMTYRGDLPSHVLVGGAASLLIAAALPAGIVERLGPWTTAAVFGAMVPVAVAVEVPYGPFDVVDVAFTLAGALVASGASGPVSTASPAERRAVLAVATVLALVAWAYRVVTSQGPA